MAIKTFYPKNALASGSNHLSLQDGGSAPTTATTGTGWTVGTTAGGYCAAMDSQNERADTSFTSGNLPDTSSGPNNSLGDCFRSENKLEGSFAAGTWTFEWKLIAVTSGGDADGHINYVMWKSPNADGSGATLLTGLNQAGNVANLTTATEDNSSDTVNPGALTFNNEYLFVQVAWKIAAGGEGGAADRDVLIRVGSAVYITTPDFTPAIALAGAATAQASGSGTLGSLTTPLEGAATAQASGGGDLTTEIRLAGGGAAQAAGSGALGTQVLLAGGGAAQADGAGALSTEIRLGGGGAAQAAASGELTLLQSLAGRRKFNAYLRFSSYKYAVTEEYRAAAWHAPLLVNVPEPEERLRDEHGLQSADTLEVEIADTALRAVLEGGSLAGAQAVIEHLLETEYSTGVVIARAASRAYTVQSFKYRPGTVVLKLADLDQVRFEGFYPAALLNATDFPAVLAAHVGEPIPVVIGGALAVPCVQVDAAAKVFAVCLGTGVTVSVVRRNARDPINVSEYSVGSATYGAWTVTTLTFTREQIDFGGQNYAITADVTGTLSGNAVAELKRLLEAAGVTCDSASFAAGVTYATTNKMTVGGAYVTQRTYTTIIRDLLLVCRASLRRDSAGAYVLVQDTPQASVASYAADTGLVEVGDFESAEPPLKVELVYGTNRLLPAAPAYPPVSRGAGGVAGVKRYEAAWVQSHESADRLSDYLAKRLQYGARVKATIYDDLRALGEVISLTAPALWSGARDWSIRGIKRIAGGAELDLLEYNAAIHTYAAQSYPADPSTGYGATPSAPATPTAAQGTGKTIRVSTTIPAENNTARFAVYRNQNGGAYSKIDTVDGTVYIDANVSHGTAYAYKLAALDGYGNESAQSAASNSVTLTTSVATADVISAAIGTAQVAGNAITTNGNAKTSSLLSLTGSWQSVQSLQVSADANDLIKLDASLFFHGSANSGSQVAVFRRLKRDSTVIETGPQVYQYDNQGTVAAFDGSTYAEPFFDVPGAGTFTYTLEMHISTTGTASCSVDYRSLYALRVKR